MSYHEWLSSNLSLSIYLPVYLTSQNSLVCFGTGSGLTEARVSRTRSRARTSRTHLVRLSPRASSYVRTVIRRFSAVPRTHRPDRTWWRTVQDSNPRLRLRRPEGYPDYPNGPRFIQPGRPIFNPTDDRAPRVSIGSCEPSLELRNTHPIRIRRSVLAFLSNPAPLPAVDRRPGHSEHRDWRVA